MRTSRFLSTAASAVIASTLFAVSPATAQDAETTADDDGGVGTIIVTANRREENLQEVPVSVGTIGGEALQVVSGAGADIRALSGRVPSLNIESSFGRTFPRFYIRGLGNTDFDLNASQPVSLVYDDVVLENPILKGFPVFDLDRVEVLRGPQGTLFGRNTPAGIVKFDTVKPGRGENYIRGSYARFDTINLEGAVGGQLSDVAAVRVSGLYQSRSDYVDNIDTADENDLEGFDEVALRAQIELEPTDDFSLRLIGQYRNLDGTARVFRANAFATGSNELIGLGGPGTEFERDEVRADGINFQELESYNLGAVWEYDLGGATITSVSSYWNANLQSRGDIDGGFSNSLPFTPPGGPGFIPFSAQSQDDIPSLDQYTQEIRIASNDADGLGYQAGFFYFNERLDIESFDFGSPTDLTPSAVARQRQVSEAWALFASLFYEFDSGLRLQGGIRYNDDKRDFSADRPVDTRPGFLGFGGPVPLITTSVEDDVVTWDLAATFPASDDVNVYARIARGFRAPSVQGRLAFGRDISVADSETTLSYEAGIKTILADGKVRFNLGGYYFTTDDLQLTAVGGANNFTTLLNADEVEGYGFEAELQARPLEGVELAGGLSYNDTQINDPNAFVAGCGAPCTVLDPERSPGSNIFSIDGNTLPQAPKWTANWSLGLSEDFGDGEVYLFTDWAYRSRVQFFLYDSVEFSDDSMLEGGLRIGYRTGPYDFAFFGRNITNDVSAVSGIDFNNLTAMVNEPRIWGVEAGITF